MEAWNRFSMMMATDRQKRQRNGIRRVRRSRRCTGGGEKVDWPVEASLAISSPCLVTFLIFLF